MNFHLIKSEHIIPKFLNNLIKIEDLLAFDEFLIEKVKCNESFCNIEEGKINFKPSFKLISGTNEYVNLVHKISW